MTDSLSHNTATTKPAHLIPILIFLILGVLTTLKTSPTFDEMAHLPAGYFYLKYQDFRLYNNNPPLSKVIAALPLLILKPHMPTGRFNNHWDYGLMFQSVNRNNYQLIFTCGRMMILLLGCILGLIIYLWSFELFGAPAAILSLILFSFSPAMIAHSSVVTADMTLTLFMFLTLYLFQKYCNTHRMQFQLLTGIALGLALLSKFTAMVIFPIILISGLMQLNWKTVLKSILIISLISVLILNAGYLFKGFMTPFRDLDCRSDLLRSFPDFLRLPLPSEWLLGIDNQMLDNQFAHPAYFFGQIYENSRQLWYFEIVCFVLKSSIPLLILILTGTAILYRHRRNEILALLIPVIVLIGFVAATVKLKIGLRYILPVYPFLFMIAGYGAYRLWNNRKSLKYLVGLLLIWHAASTIKAFPNYISYFNEFIGSNHNGYQYLVDSNLDWGQDLPALKTFMTENQIDKIKLSYFGTVKPQIYHINYELIPEIIPRSGWVAISATHLTGVYSKQTCPLQTMFQSDADLSFFRNLKPSAFIGNSMLVYHLGVSKTKMF